MRIREITGAFAGAPRQHDPGPAPRRDSAFKRALDRARMETARDMREAGEQRAARTASASEDRPLRARPYTPFIAQLAAGYIGLPQTRARRRASPDDANTGYVTTSLLSSQAWLGTRRKRAL